MNFAVLIVVLFGMSACTPKKDSASNESPEALALARAKSVYNSNCAVCHGVDPHLLKDGNAGPNIFGSSEALLRSRMILGSYPEGYTPKRIGEGMPKFPHLEKEIPGLTVYLNTKN